MVLDSDQLNAKRRAIELSFINSVFDSVIVVVFKIIFYTKIYVNDFFYFLKIIFYISTSK